MLHRFAFAGGRVSYANCFLKSNAFWSAAKTGKISYAEFATDPCRTLFGRVAAIFDPKLTDNCCVNVSDYARKRSPSPRRRCRCASRPRHSRLLACSAIAGR